MVDSTCHGRQVALPALLVLLTLPSSGSPMWFVWWDLLLFEGCTVFPCVNLPHLLHPFIGR